MPARAVRVIPSLEGQGHPNVIEELGQLQLRPSPLRPHCLASERIYVWKGINTPPPHLIQSSLIHYLADIASRASLRDPSSYGSGLRKFHLFCDIFSIPEEQRLPASFAVLHSFALWAVADPDPLEPAFVDGTPFEPVSVKAARQYLSAIRAWHIAQGWPPPLTKDSRDRIEFSLRGLENIQRQKRKRPPRPPVTIHMLAALRSMLELDNSFDACVWAVACCAFWGLMRFGEVTVHSRADFSEHLHLTRAHAIFGSDLDGKPYVRLDLPSAKTARPGEVQQIFLVEQGSVCPIRALGNLGRVVPAGERDPLFSWRDQRGDVRPMTRKAALDRINQVFGHLGYGTTFGHSFRIGGASYLLSQKVDPEIVRIQGRWKSLAYELYIRSFEQVVSRHTSGLAANYGY